MKTLEEHNEDAIQQAMAHEEAAVALNRQGVPKRWL